MTQGVLPASEVLDLMEREGSSPAITVTLQAHWEGLWQQKILLVKAIDGREPLTADEKNLLDGLVGFLDTITDEAHRQGVWKYHPYLAEPDEVENAHGLHTPPGDWPNAERDPEDYLPSYVEYPEPPDDPGDEAPEFDPEEPGEYPDGNDLTTGGK